jgi:type III pantothenate kinase
VRLLVDIGNTRVKWATCADGRLSPQQAATHADWTDADWARLFAGVRGLQQVVAAGVAAAATRERLVRAAASSGVEDVRFVMTTAAAAGVRNAYRDPRLLGVDRWVAVIGAHHLYGACCIADVGTAATIDAVDASGLHLGGFIVPGPHMMVRALWSGTSDLAAHSAASRMNEATLFADNTRDAIERGCRVALAALIDRSVQETSQRTGVEPRLLLTGGAALEVLPYVQAPSVHVPDLVLRGLAWLSEVGAT